MNKPSTLQNSLMLAPLIGATDSLMSALGVWLMFIVVMGAYGAGMAPLRSRLVPASHLLAAVLLAATLTSCANIAAQVLSLQWHRSMGLYPGLIALQCIVLEHAGFFKNDRGDRLRLGLLFGALMVGLGLMRESLTGIEVRLAALAPGGFILSGLLLAAWRAWPRPPSSH